MIFFWILIIGLWLVAGNRYLQCDGVGKAGMLNEDDELTVEGCEVL